MKIFYLYLENIKMVETRSFKTNYRGEIYIHASLKKVNLKDKTATIYSTASINNEDIKKIIKKLDYQIISIGEDK